MEITENERFSDVCRDRNGGGYVVGHGSGTWIVTGMTIDEAITDFEKCYPGYRWNIHQLAYINGFFQGEGKSRIDAYSPFSSGGPPRWMVICDKDNIPDGFLNLKMTIEALPSGNW